LGENTKKPTKKKIADSKRGRRGHSTLSTLPVRRGKSDCGHKKKKKKEKRPLAKIKGEGISNSG